MLCYTGTFLEDDGYGYSRNKSGTVLDYLASKFIGAPTPGTLIMVRHGESEWNQRRLFTGWVDVDLSDRYTLLYICIYTAYVSILCIYMYVYTAIIFIIIPYIHISIYTYIHISIYTYIYIYIVYWLGRRRLVRQVCMYIYTAIKFITIPCYVCICLLIPPPLSYLYIFTYIHTYIHTHIHIHTYIHTYTHTYIHT
jgi:hypothetical protein